MYAETETWRCWACTSGYNMRGVLLLRRARDVQYDSQCCCGGSRQEAVRLALHDNPALQAQQQMTTAAEGELRQARTFPNNPRLEWEGSPATKRTRPASRLAHYAKLSQELPLGGKWHQ